MTPAPDGLLVVDKPGGWTSHDVVGRVRRLAHTRKVGHAGTLDPMATGVLVLGIGRATRLLGHLALTDKTYTATIRLGATTVTDDAEGEVVEVRDASEVTDAAVAGAMAALTGEIAQVPSSVSAVKVDGVRSYARVRAGEAVELAARRVTVSRFALLERRGDDLDVVVDCTSGTYVRALARDLGAALGVGGHLTALRRTRVGPFGLEVARTLEQAAQELGIVRPPGADRGRGGGAVVRQEARADRPGRNGGRLRAGRALHRAARGPRRRRAADGGLRACLGGAQAVRDQSTDGDESRGRREGARRRVVRQPQQPGGEQELQQHPDAQPRVARGDQHGERGDQPECGAHEGAGLQRGAHGGLWSLTSWRSAAISLPRK
jgi:tRNA pseudouridine55 synthase